MVVDSVRNEVLDMHAQLAQEPHQERRRRQPVDIIVAMDKHRLGAIDGAIHQAHSLIDVRQGARVVQLTA